MDAKEALQNLRKNSDAPLFWDHQDINGVLRGKAGKTHTILIQVEVPKIRTDYKIDVVGDGQILDTREGECHTWGRNYWNALVSNMSGFQAADTVWQAGDINGKDTGGVVRRTSSGEPFVLHHSITCEDSTGGVNHGYLATKAQDSFGIVVGTSTAAESFEDHALTTQIDHGLAAGELYYATSETPAPDTWTSGTRTFAYPLTRYFDNFNAALNSITLNEMGQYSRQYISVIRTFMMARDLISPGLIVPYRSQAGITYTYSLVFPSSGSPLRNFYNMAFASGASLNTGLVATFGDGFLNTKDTSGAINIGESSITFPVNDDMQTFTGTNEGYTAASTADGTGILVGSDNTAVTFDDFAMGVLINHGAAGGELGYSITENVVGAWDGGTLVYSVTHARTFANTSGGNVTVRESGLVGRIAPGDGLDRSIMTLHDVFADVVVANGEDLRVVYVFNTTFPS